MKLSRIDQFRTKLKREAWFARIGYTPHENQNAVHSANARFKVVVCGRRFGKSELAAKEIEYMLMDVTRKVDILTVAPIYANVAWVFDKVYDDLFINNKLQNSFSKISQSNRTLVTKWGSTFTGRSADNPEHLVGGAYDLVVVDEAAKMKESVWTKYLRPTLTDRNGISIFPTTPEGKNWIYKRYLQGLDPNRQEWEAFNFPSVANPHISAKDIEEAREELSEEEFQQEYEGSFVGYKGKVYKGFQIATHVTDIMPVEFDGWVMGIDWGYVNPTTMLAIGIKDGTFYVVDEIYETRLSEEDILERAKELRSKYPLSTGYADHAPGKISILNDNGFDIIKAKKNVAEGIASVAAKIKVKKNGKSSLLVHPRCENLIQELDSYRYADTARTNTKEEPLKINDHAVDALRYAIYSREKTLGYGVIE